MSPNTYKDALCYDQGHIDHILTLENINLSGLLPNHRRCPTPVFHRLRFAARGSMKLLNSYCHGAIYQLMQARIVWRPHYLSHATSQWRTKTAQVFMDREDVNVNNVDYHNAVGYGSVDIFRTSIKRPEIGLDVSDARTFVLSATAQCGTREIFQTAMNIAKNSPTGFEFTRSTTLHTAAKKNGNTRILQGFLAPSMKTC